MLSRLWHFLLNLWRKYFNTRQATKVAELPTDEELSIDWNFRWMLVSLARRCSTLRETQGHNRSPEIDQINAFMGLPKGSAYCLSGLYVKVIQELCNHMEIYNPLPKTGSTQKFWEKVPDKYKRLPGTKAKKGDIGIMRNRKYPSSGHAFLVTEDETNTIPTIEFNTNISGVSDGEGVYELKRTQQGTLSQEYLGAVDVVTWLRDTNPSLEE